MNMDNTKQRRENKSYTLRVYESDFNINDRSLLAVLDREEVVGKTTSQILKTIIDKHYEEDAAKVQTLMKRYLKLNTCHIIIDLGFPPRQYRVVEPEEKLEDYFSLNNFNHLGMILRRP